MAPYGRLPPEEQTKGNFPAQIQAGLSIPTSTNINSKRSSEFSTFYTASVTFPFVISIAYWLVLYPSVPVSDYGGNDQTLYYFLLINITVLNSVIALLEIMILSSVRKPKVLSLLRQRNTCLKVTRIWPSRSSLSSPSTSYTQFGRSLAVSSLGSMCTSTSTPTMPAGEALLPLMSSSCH